MALSWETGGEERGCNTGFLEGHKRGVVCGGGGLAFMSVPEQNISSLR